jgi:hypothetical protein
MATGNTYVSSLNSLFALVYEEAFLTLRANNIMANLVTSYTDRQGTEDRIFSTRPSVSMSGVNENEDFATPTVFGKTAAGTATPTMQMAQIVLTDRELRQDPETRSEAARELGAAAAQKIERDLTGLFDNATGGTVGTANNASTWGHIQAATSILQNGAVPGRYAAVLNTLQYHRLGTAVALQTNLASLPEMVADELARQWYVGSYGLVDFFTTPNVVPDGSDDATGCVFNRGAFALDMRLAPRMEVERDASYGGGAWEFNIVADYGVAVRRGALAVAVIGDASTPT